MTIAPDAPKQSSWLDRPIFSFFPALTGEMLLFLLIILLAAITRFYNLGQRAMSHDETLHTYFSWLFSQGKGYQHTPLMHGPLLFHLTALAYQIFGSSDFISRFPQALSSILTIALLWKWHRYLGRAGTIAAAVLMLISPFMLYYGRYARNEAFVALFGVLTLYAILRYFETGRARYLVLLTVATALHFTSKETAFIYTAQAMLFLGAYLINRVTHRPWTRNSRLYNPFLIVLAIGILLIGATFGLVLYNRTQVPESATQTAAPLLPGGATLPVSASHPAGIPPVTILALVAGLAIVGAAFLLILGYGWQNLCRERSFAMLVLLGTFVLPQLTAFPVTALGWDPLAYQFTWPGWNLPALWAQAPVRTGVVFLILVGLSVTIGLLWDSRRWWIYAILFWGIYVIFFTSVFSNWEGFFTGSVGSLGYWLVQQGVHRGDQPWYYYLLIQVPIYEFLPTLGLLLAILLKLRQGLIPHPKLESGLKVAEDTPTVAVPEAVSAPSTLEVDHSEGDYTFPLLVWWAFSSLLAYTLAGEKMPWLTVHITLPMILLTGWAINQLVQRIDWIAFKTRRGTLATLFWIVLLLSLGSALLTILGANPPFQGKTLPQLSATGSFLFIILLAGLSLSGLAWLYRSWPRRQMISLALLVFFGILAFLTGRAAFRAAYVNYDNATEYLVYAHGATGITDAVSQITTISSRIAGEKNLKIAYDNNLPKQGLSWSFKWYFRNFPNAVSFDKPDDSLRDYPVILVDVNNFNNIKTVVGNDYYKQEFVRMVWPNQDYFNVTWLRIKAALTNPAMRAAILQIWLNRDFSTYAAVTGKAGLTLSDWQPSDRMQLYIRKDVAAQIWDYAIPQPVVAQVDPYEKGTISLAADKTIGDGTQLNAPRGLAFLPDGSLVVADSRNNRLQHYSADGKLLNSWGQASPGCPYAQLPPKDVPLGTFCEPWAVAVSPDGEWIYVADTWNHRIQKLTAAGKAIKAWGTANYDPISSGPLGLWGPRGLAVDARGHVLVADTGNKRVIVYDSDGNFVFQFGGSGLAPGQLEEPVGLALDSNGTFYVADTWNQRIQTFAPNSDGTAYTPVDQWAISGWNGESLDNKPYLAVDSTGHVFATDPEGYRVLEFDSSGKFLRAWGSYGTGPDNFGLASGIAVDSQDHIWVGDSANNRLMRFTLP